MLLIGSGFIYFKKDAIIAEVLKHANEDFKGLVQIEKTTISPFENFPYISIKVHNLKVFESKQVDTLAVIDVKTAYLGFDFWNVVKNNLVVKKLSLENGSFNIIQDNDGNFNIVKAFEPAIEETEDDSMPLILDFKEITLTNIDLKKESLETKIILETDIDSGIASFEKNEKDMQLVLDAKFLFNVFDNGKPTYIYHKHLELHTSFIYHTDTQVVDFLKTTVLLEGADFDMTGKIDVDDGMDVDLRFSGNKPSFDLVIGFAPEELIPVLRSYENRGKVYFDAHFKGKTANNQMPAINAKFGCENGFILNPEVNKSLDQLTFHSTFTNGAARNNSTSKFELKEFNTRPEAGDFKASLAVTNFDSPEIDMQLDSDFDLDFLTKFFKLKDLSNLTGKVLLTMNFHDIIDLQHPEKALEKLNQAYYSKLEIKDLNFKSDSYHLPLENLNVEARITGEMLDLKNCSFKLGESDITLQGKITDFPAVIHQANDPVTAELHINSKKIDVGELTPKTPGKEPLDEQLTNLKFDLVFKGLANTFLTSKSLPVGNYYLTNISAKLKNYEHALKNLNGTFYINENDVLVKRLDGKLDTSDFHFEGKIGHYDLWLADVKNGDTNIEFDLTSNDLYFKDIFTYKGENFMPDEYRNEDLQDFKLHGRVALHYKETLQSTDFYLTELRGKLKMHPLTFKNFNGNVHLENDVLAIRNVSGSLGENDFKLNGTYFLNNPAKTHTLNFESARLNINELITFNEPQIATGTSTTTVDHDAGYNIFKEPFPNARVNAKITDLRFNKYHLTNLTAQAGVKENHFVNIDKLQFNAASGLVEITGYFNGSNPKHVYLHPDIKVQKVNIDEVLFKFDNFGQDVMVSENLHGIVTGRIRGKIWLHTDFTPSMEDTELTIDATIENGRLDNFAPMQAMSSFFGDKNLNRIKFDTLQNRLTFKNGRLSFPNMQLNSSLGYMEISGSQGVDLTMDYYLRIPLKLVGKAAFGKLFGRKPEEISPDQEDDLIIRDTSKKTRFVNVHLTGTPDDFNIALRKNKDVKAGVQFNKTDDFMFEDLKSEFEDKNDDDNEDDNED